jgi:hypothetical protein
VTLQETRVHAPRLKTVIAALALTCTASVVIAQYTDGVIKNVVLNNMSGLYADDQPAIQ